MRPSSCWRTAAWPWRPPVTGNIPTGRAGVTSGRTVSVPTRVLDLVPRPAPPPPPELRPLVRGSRLLRGARLDSRAVLDAIANKAALARAWGLRIVSAVPNVKGWLRCRAIGREDRHPSAGFHAFTGYYNEPFRLRYSLFELGSVLGPYEDWRHCRDSLAALVGITPEVPCS
jgi:hypothetical protein